MPRTWSVPLTATATNGTPGAGGQPTRPGLEPGITEFLHADALGKQTDHAPGLRWARH